MGEIVRLLNGVALETDEPSLVSILGSASSGKNHTQYKFITDYSKKNLPVLFINLEAKTEVAIRQIKRKLNLYNVKNHKNIFFSGGYIGFETSKILDLCTKNDFKAIFIESSRLLYGDIGRYNSNKRILLLEKSENKIGNSDEFKTTSEKMNKVYSDLRTISVKTNTHVFVSESIYRRSLQEGNVHTSNSRLLFESDIVLVSKINEETKHRTHNVKVVKNRYGFDSYYQNFII